MKLLYKLSRSVIPCILLTLCIGWCYSFSLFSPEIREIMDISPKAVQFTFCLNIFFLGMGAAMFGPLAERHIRLSALTSSILLLAGMVLSGIAINLKSVWLLYLGSGLFAGISEGAGYVTPNKNMLLWFPTSKAKGLLTAISIFTFGLGSSLCSWMFGLIFPKVGIANMFFYLAAIYAVPLAISVILINKPRYALIKLKNQLKSDFSYLACLKDSYFRRCWLYMFLNISMGLILIGSCASFLKHLGMTSERVIFLMMLCGIFNGVGRLVFPVIGDFLKTRSAIWLITAMFEVVLMVPVILAYSTGIAPLSAAICIVLIHAGYGSAFACLPGILSTHYGKDTLSQRHGFCLTSWGMASLMAFLCTTFILKHFEGLTPVMVTVVVGYVINILVSTLIMGGSKKDAKIV